MGNSSEQLLDYPRIQLDPSELDVVELILGGLLDNSAMDLVSLPGWAEIAKHDGQDVYHLVLSDPDGTALAVVDYRIDLESTDSELVPTIISMRPLAAAEHGQFRSLRVNSSLGENPVVIFNRAPTAKDLSELMSRDPLPAGTRFIVICHGSEAHGPAHAQTVDQLKAAASLFPGVLPGHLVLPRSVDVSVILQRVSSKILADFCVIDENRQATLAGAVVMFSGLSGSGKSTLARAVQEGIHRQLAQRAVLLDGDDIRRFISKGLGFSRQDRETNVERIGWIAARIAEAGGIALCAPIAPFAATRDAVKDLVKPVGRFHLVHVSTPLEVCEQRDRKGLYTQARAGKIKDFTGIDSPYEEPANPDLTLDLSVMDIATATEQVMSLLKR